MWLAEDVDVGLHANWSCCMGCKGGKVTVDLSDHGKTLTPMFSPRSGHPKPKKHILNRDVFHLTRAHMRQSMVPYGIVSFRNTISDHYQSLTSEAGWCFESPGFALIGTSSLPCFLCRVL